MDGRMSVYNLMKYQIFLVQTVDRILIKKTNQCSVNAHVQVESVRDWAVTIVATTNISKLCIIRTVCKRSVIHQAKQILTNLHYTIKITRANRSSYKTLRGLN